MASDRFGHSGPRFLNKFLVSEGGPQNGMTNFAIRLTAVSHKAINLEIIGNFITFVITSSIVAFCIFLVVKGSHQNEAPGAERSARIKKICPACAILFPSKHALVLIAQLNPFQRRALTL